MRRLGRGLTALLIAASAAIPAAADEAVDYAAAVDRVLTLVRAAQTGDRSAAAEAVSLLQQGIAGEQPELLSDLRQNPPDLAQAARRLGALRNAVDRRPDTASPAAARETLKQVLAHPRYNAMRAGPSLTERVLNWLLQRFLELLGRLRGGGLNLLNLLLVGAGGIALAVVAVVLVRAFLSRRSDESAPARAGAVEAAPVDRFAQADRSAAQGDYSGALRALAAAVASALGGEAAWEQSPLTVRELFRRADPPESLRPLLVPFEAAAYGGRPPDADAYTRAAEVAARFRRSA